MIQKRLEDITLDDLNGLIADEVTERKTLDYKRELPGLRDADKKEFLADVSSFANASGGDMLFGLEEEVDDAGNKTGKPKSIVPIVGETSNDAILRLEQTVRTGIDPKVRVETRVVAVSYTHLRAHET